MRKAILLSAIMVLPASAWASTTFDANLRRLEEQQQRMLTDQARLRDRLDSAKLAIIRRDLRAKGLPKLADGDAIVEHPGHMLVYSEPHEQPEWVAHIAVPDLITGNLARIDSFVADPEGDHRHRRHGGLLEQRLRSRPHGAERRYALEPGGFAGHLLLQQREPAET
ncbi:MAG: hypothetical protein IPM46_00160 [Flavobacteriales bacterium]|nr:hypothetical protein [Flavobacteriales bacterium]